MDLKLKADALKERCYLLVEDSYAVEGIRHMGETFGDRCALGVVAFELAAWQGLLAAGMGTVQDSSHHVGIVGLDAGLGGLELRTYCLVSMAWVDLEIAAVGMKVLCRMEFGL